LRLLIRKPVEPLGPRSSLLHPLQQFQKKAVKVA